MTRLIQSVTSIVLSLLLGAVALAFTAIYAPETLESLQIGADQMNNDLLSLATNLGAQSNVKVWVRFLVGDQQLVFMGFVIATRIALSLIGWALASATNAMLGRPVGAD